MNAYSSYIKEQQDMEYVARFQKGRKDGAGGTQVAAAS